MRLRKGTLDLIRIVAAFALTLSITSLVQGCPLCESEAGKRVRSGIFDADFGFHLTVTLLPFLVFVAIVGLIHFGPPWPRTSSQAVDAPRQGQGETPVGHAGKDQQWTTG